MSKLVIEDVCLTPKGEVSIEYSGPRPFLAAKRIGKELSSFFQVSGASSSERRVEWDVSGDPISFYLIYEVKKKMSAISTLYFKIRIRGEKFKTKDEGKFTLFIEGKLKTEVSGLLKSFWWIYSYLFYNKARREYLKICQDFIERFKNEYVKDLFKLEKAK